MEYSSSPAGPEDACACVCLCVGACACFHSEEGRWVIGRWRQDGRDRTNDGEAGRESERETNVTRVAPQSVSFGLISCYWSRVGARKRSRRGTGQRSMTSAHTPLVVLTGVNEEVMVWSEERCCPCWYINQDYIIEHGRNVLSWYLQWTPEFCSRSRRQHVAVYQQYILLSAPNVETRVVLVAQNDLVLLFNPRAFSIRLNRCSDEGPVDGRDGVSTCTARSYMLTAAGRVSHHLLLHHQKGISHRYHGYRGRCCVVSREVPTG